MILFGTVKNKKFNHERMLMDLISRFDGKYISINIKEGKKRSIQQNNYYFGVIVKYLKDHLDNLGNDFTSAEVHEWIAEEFAPKKEIKNPFTGELAQVRMSTADLSTHQFEEYLEKIRSWAASDQGVMIPLPNEVISE